MISREREGLVGAFFGKIREGVRKFWREGSGFAMRGCGGAGVDGVGLGTAIGDVPPGME
jgi:hypothetical protein